MDVLLPPRKHALCEEIIVIRRWGCGSRSTMERYRGLKVAQAIRFVDEIASLCSFESNWSRTLSWKFSDTIRFVNQSVNPRHMTSSLPKLERMHHRHQSFHHKPLKHDYATRQRHDVVFGGDGHTLLAIQSTLPNIVVVPSFCGGKPLITSKNWIHYFWSFSTILESAPTKEHLCCYSYHANITSKSYCCCCCVAGVFFFFTATLGCFFHTFSTNR